MKKLNGQWTFSTSEEYFNECEYYDTKEEAIEAAKEYYDEDHEDYGYTFYVGQIEAIKMRADDLADVVIEHIQQDHFDNDGEFGQEYLDNVTKDHLRELDHQLEKLLNDWADKYGYQPKHFFVRNIEAIEVER